MKSLIIICGIISALLTLFHIAFWWILDWPAGLAYMTAEHRMLMQTFNFCMIPIFIFFTYSLFALREEILTTRIGRALLWANAGLYLFRSAAELIFGNIRTSESQFFFILCLVIGVLFIVPTLKKKIKDEDGRMKN
ncbi:MAG: hypothetical protein EHM45_09550 [Desulfobacteraceae bacterium]|nr:MAG: hypothetical protein EHM45_09550 [Desulfobacteraceae bacterium]